MSDSDLWRATETSLTDGIWTVHLAASGGADRATPDVTATWRDLQIETAPERHGNGWRVQVPLHAEIIGDGVATVLLKDGQDGIVAACHVAAGRAMEGDLIAEVARLRAELDLLKRAFRRHCAESEG